MEKNSNRIIYIIAVVPITIIVIFLALQFIVSNSRGPVQTNWTNVETMLTNNDIEKIVVVNDKDANIYIKQDRLKNYEQEFNKGRFSKPSESGPHLTFNIGSVETFEKKLQEAQTDSIKKINPIYEEHRNWMGEIFWAGFPMVLIVILIIVYFIPTFIARKKENFMKIALLNVLAGWTVLGWVASLYWAISSNKNQTIYTHICTRCGYKYTIHQKVKLFVCPNCNTENKITETTV